MKFLFFLSQSYSLPVIQPVSKYLRDTEHEQAFQVKNSLAATLRNILPLSDDLPVFTDSNQAIAFNPDFVLVPGNYLDYRLPGIKVEIFHGIGIEKSSHYKIRPYFDVYCTSGPAVTRVFRDSIASGRKQLVIETGWPKIDYILRYHTQELRDRFALPRGKKIILYAPTFSPGLSSLPYLIPALPKLISTGEFWFIKLHDLTSDVLQDRLNRILNNRMKLITDNDITPYLHMADLLISDTSSVVYEFMVLDKPVVTFRARDRKDKGINVENTGDLRKAIDRSLTFPAEFSPQRRTHIQDINPYLNGNISRNLIEQLLNLKKTGFRPTRRFINPWRKYQIRRWLRE